MGVKIVLADHEHIGKALIRFKRLVERHGVTKEMRVHRYYEKPSKKRHRKTCHAWWFRRVHSRSY